MTTKPVRLKAKSHTTAQFLAQIDEVVVEPSMVTAATAVIDGRVVLYLGNAYLNIPIYPDGDDRLAAADTERELILKHEAAHLAMQHQRRLGERNQDLFNQICDCAIHHHWASADIATLDRLIDAEVCTYERMGLDALPPELAYDQYEQHQQAHRPGGDAGDADTGLGRIGPTGGAAEQKQEAPSGGERQSSCRRPSEGELQDAYAESKPGTDLVQDAQNASKAAQVQDAIIEGMKEDYADGDRSIPEAITYNIPDTLAAGNGESHAGRSERGNATPPQWTADLIDQLETGSAKVERGHSWKRQHREDIEFLPGRGRVRGVEAVIMIDASGSINTEAMNQMLAALQDGGFGQSIVYVHDTRTLGPWEASDDAGIQGGVAQCGGGTHIRKCWEQVEGDVDPDLIRVFFGDACDWDNELPLPCPSDIWVYLQYGSITIESTESLARSLTKRGRAPKYLKNGVITYA